MDEYDELFEIEDDFENQYADELEALADMEKGEQQQQQQLANTECWWRFSEAIHIILIKYFRRSRRALPRTG